LAKTLTGSDFKNLDWGPICTFCTPLALRGSTQRSGKPYWEMDDAFSNPVFINLLAVLQRGEGVKGRKMDYAIRSQVLPNPNLLHSSTFRGVASYIPVFRTFLKKESFLLHRTVFVNTLNVSYRLFLPEPEQQCNKSA
jgi:hypothetical protein